MEDLREWKTERGDVYLGIGLETIYTFFFLSAGLIKPV